MKKELRIQDNEPLHDWIDRIAEAMHMTLDQKAVMHEVSKLSYIKGTNTINDAYEIKQLHYNIEYADNGIIIRDPDMPYTEVVAFGENDDTQPCKTSLGTMIWDDLEMAEKQADWEDYCGYKLTINIEPLRLD